MLDFYRIATRSPKKGTIEVYPKFIVGQSEDLMIRGHAFYAVWNEQAKCWSTDENVAIRLIDISLDEYVQNELKDSDDYVRVLHLWDTDTGMIDKWKKYIQHQLCDNSFKSLDNKLIFSNSDVTRKDYSSKHLPYALSEGSTPAYDELMSVLYSDEERHKLEWAIGSIVNGDSIKIQKFLVLYGSGGTGKSTVLNIIQDLFSGYYSVFDAKALGSSSASFPLESLKTNPLVAIQHDGDLSRIEDNTRLNSVVSHEEMTINEKFKSAYTIRFNCFLFMGTNKPVKITDAKSGILRRLIDVSPTGNKVPKKRYDELIAKIKFELGGIAWKCKEVYEDDPYAYDAYVPLSMFDATNDFFNFVEDHYDIFDAEDAVTLKRAWALYNTYCDETNMTGRSYRVFKQELKNYFEKYDDDIYVDGKHLRSYYSGFIRSKFVKFASTPKEEVKETPWLQFEEQDSLFDILAKDYPAQLASKVKESPTKKWANVKTTLEAIDTHELHYVKVPENHIVIDFDIKDESGNKSFDLNLKAALAFPETYAELSKSGAGIHLHYIYEGDVNLLDRHYGPDIEVKVFKGDSSLRRKLTKCNTIDIRSINSGLPLKEVKKMVNKNIVMTEQRLQAMIARNLNKEFGSTSECVQFIYNLLEQAYETDGLHYDVSSMYPAIYDFASSSTHQADNCLKLVRKMKLCSKECGSPLVTSDVEAPLIFFDVEVYPNLFIICWKKPGPDNPVHSMVNPEPELVEDWATRYSLIGFNNRRYDNHIVYAAMMGYTNEMLFDISQRIIENDKTAFFGEAYNLSYTDIYDFSSEKKSLKKFEIELGIHHQEMGLPWDQPVAEDLWGEVVEYCKNDVLATEEVWKARSADFTARKILAKIACMTVNDTTNSLTTRIIFGSNKHPALEYTDLSIMFPGYLFENFKSTYRGEVVGEGGYVYSEPGMYTDVALLDIASMHPNSLIQLNLFGDEYTARFKDILDIRIAIKHKEFERARTMLDGQLAPFLDDEEQAAALAQALKIAINSVYGLTSAKFDNPFRDPRNVDNIVAKRGALFMINLRHEVQARGFTVAHIKTDSIKIPNATPEIIQFVMDYGKQYGYSFEHEATYERMCLVNDAVYIAKYKDGKHAGEWAATGTQFQIPYVFKSLFSKEPLIFDDYCVTKSATSSLYLDFNESMVAEYFDHDLEFFARDFDNVKKFFDKKQKSDPDNALKYAELCNNMHDYRFVGKVGNFCPVKIGYNGGLLYREQNGKYNYAAGAKGYRWMEAEVLAAAQDTVRDKIDISYHKALADDAIATISQYGDFEWFVSED